MITDYLFYVTFIQMNELKLKFRVRHTRMNLPCSKQATSKRELSLFRAMKKNIVIQK